MKSRIFKVLCNEYNVVIYLDYEIIFLMILKWNNVYILIFIGNYKFNFGFKYSRKRGEFVNYEFFRDLRLNF